MARTSPIERAPDHGPERDRASIMRNPDVTPEQQRQVADALHVLAESDQVDVVVEALGLKTNLEQGPVHDFLVNNGPARVGTLLSEAFTKAEAALRARNDVPGMLQLKQTQASVRKILAAQGGSPELSADQRSAA